MRGRHCFIQSGVAFIRRSRSDDGRQQSTPKDSVSAKTNGGFYCSSIEANFTTTHVCHFAARISAAWWSRMGAVLITHLPPVHFRSAWWVAGSDNGAAHGNMHLLFSALPGSHQLAQDCVGKTSTLDWPRHQFLLVFLANTEKREKALLIIHRVYRQGNKIERADLERLVGLLGGSPIPCQP